MKIQFHSKYINTISFEETLKKYYKKSISDNIRVVEFDFSHIEWCETLQLSQIILWICKLLPKKNVRFIPPSPTPFKSEIELTNIEIKKKLKRRSGVFQFLVDKLVIKFLLDNGILKKEDISSFGYRELQKKVEDDILPLEFFSMASDFQDFMERLYRQYKLYFKDLLDRDIIRYGEIQDIVLKELGNNLFDHTKSKYGHIIMCHRLPVFGSKVEINRIKKATISTAPYFEKDFFSNIGNGGYIGVIVSDEGPGIYNTLVQEYHRDKILKEKNLNPTENDIIEYAFYRYTTRKDQKTRMGELNKFVNDSDKKNLIPATGLHWVKEVVKEYNGMLTIRSGRSIICYDFLSYPINGFPGKSPLNNLSDNRLSSLANFGGTQIKIYFPTDIPKNAQSKNTWYYRSQKSKIKRDYIYVPFDGPPPDKINDGSHIMEKWLDEQNQLIETKLQSSKNEKVLVIDLDTKPNFNIKAFKPFFLYMINLTRIQNDSTIIILLSGNGVIEIIGRDLQKIISNQVGVKKEKPILSIDKNLGLSIFGLTDIEAKIFHELVYLSSKEIQTDISKYDFFLLKKLDHLIIYNESQQLFQTLFSLNTIFQETIKNIRKNIASIILDNKNNIYHKDGCYLIPSVAYSEGFFEINNFLRNKNWVYELKRWIKYIVYISKPQVIVLIGLVSTQIYEMIKSYGEKKIKILFINENEDKLSKLLNLGSLPSTLKTLIITDVIGTKSTIGTVLDIMYRIKEVNIAVIVDAQTTDENKQLLFNGKKYPLYSIVKKKLNYWFKTKPTQYRYDEILKIDPITKNVVTEPIIYENPIWKGIDPTSGTNSFINEILKNTKSIINGHFENNNIHLLYLFHTQKIISYYNSQIVKCIAKDIKKYKKKLTNSEDAKISLIIYPSQSPGLNDLAQLIANYYSITNIQEVSSEELKYPWRLKPIFDNIEDIIIVDDATSTGSTIRRLMEVAETYSSGTIFIYIICNRGDRTASRTLQKIEGYGHSTIHTRYLSEMPIPTFTKDFCPICHEIQEYKHLRVICKPVPKLLECLEKEIVSKKEIQISTVFNQSTFHKSSEAQLRKTELRAQLELAKDFLPIRKKLADLIRKKGDDFHDVLIFFSLVTDEELYWVSNTRTFKEIFYSSFRESIKDICKKIISNYSSFASDEIIVTIKMLRMIDPDQLIKTLDKHHFWIKDKELFLRINIQLLRSTRLIELAPYVASIIEKNNTNSTIVGSMIDLWRNFEKRIENNSKDVYKIYSKLDISLTDSEPIRQKLEGLIFKITKKQNIKSVKTIIDEFWKPSYSLLQNEIIKNIAFIGSSNISDYYCDQLNKIAGIIQSSLIYTNDLAKNIKKSDDILFEDSIIEDFEKSIIDLMDLLLSIEENKLRDTLDNLKTDICDVIKSAINRYESTPHKDLIIQDEIPDEPCYIFGQKSDVYVVINNFIDNSIKRGFVKKKKNKKIIIRLTQNDNSVKLSIMDNGIGIANNFQMGIGLSRVNIICSKIGMEWNIRQIKDGEFNTDAFFKFYYISKSF